jgi:HAD superfamily hydrolase (TIGR01549 family)
MRLDVARIQALCFDVDGTLRDTDDALVADLTGWLKPVQYLYKPFNPQRFARRFVMAIENPGSYLYGIPDRLGIDGWLATMSDLIKVTGISRTGKYAIIPSVREMLVELHLHYPLSVVSARSERKTIEFLDNFELRSYFKAIATAQTVRHTKPYPDPIIWAAQQMDVPPQAILMVGDTTVDIRAGKAAGAQTAAVLCGFGEDEELRRAGADIILDNPAQLISILLAKPLTN